MAHFPSPEWAQALMEKINSDEKYAQVARNWEGDMRVILEPDETFKEGMVIYLDLWHGKCRQAFIETDLSARKPAFILKSSYANFARVVRGELEPMQALLTRKMGVQGNMAVLMRNVPTVLDFVRCAREVTSSTL